MCLYLYNKKEKTRKTAQKDITCWKILVQYRSVIDPNEMRFESIFERYPYQLNCVMRDTNREDIIEVDREKDIRGDYPTMVNGGFFHTYVKKKDAVKDAMVWGKMQSVDRNCIVVKCIIPKDTEYYEGAFKVTRNGLIVRSYASKSLRVTDEVSVFVNETYNN